MSKILFAVAGFMMLPIVALAQDDVPGDPEQGERVFRKCMACHAVGEDAKNKVGPVLNGIIGRTVATVDGFNYSDVLADLGEQGKVWSPEELAAFLEKPRDYAEGTKMSFVGLRKEDERANVIAYLATFPEEGS